MKPKSSQYRGVSFHRVHRLWIAFIRDPSLPFAKRHKYIGIYKTELDAAQAYNEAAKRILGPEAVLNVLPEDPPPPTSDEIAAACEEIRAGWSPRDFINRAPHWAPVDHDLPFVVLSELAT